MTAPSRTCWPACGWRGRGVSLEALFCCRLRWPCLASPPVADVRPAHVANGKGCTNGGDRNGRNGCGNASAKLEPCREEADEVCVKRGVRGKCVGCGGEFGDVHKHMRKCCPESLPRSADPEAVALHRKELSPNDWLDKEEIRAAARAAVAALADPLQRRALELRFGLDQGGVRRSPVQVGEVLGGKYAKNGQTAQVLIRTALGNIPLVADDPSGLKVLYEDDDMIAVFKPPFLRTTPVHRFCGKSLSSQVIGHLLRSGWKDPPHVVHRLDQCTSGVYLTAKTKKAAASLQEYWHGPTCGKEYLAVVHVRDQDHLKSQGKIFEVDAPIGRSEDLADDVSRRVDPENGQPARTRFEVLAIGEAVALMSCTLVEMGRTHQIRVHAAHAGFPLMGDDLYGGSGSSIGRVALHAWHLRVRQPTTGETVLIEAPVPTDMEQCCVAHGVELGHLQVATSCEKLLDK
eukprot:TRINITY_DN24258_c0_g1_i1.p1 TRINITY_DN24258_c0_g1~~TRINITY_DN24258_c0_g1_i1.p1  ORF type:complete len:460 (+),score=73.00 TRINITY_DN24258_c0_g1_i1:68-1447(+)